MVSGQKRQNNKLNQTLCKSNGKYICFWARTNESKEKQHAFPLHTSHWSIQVYLRSTEMQSVSLSNHSAACLSLCLPLINKGVGLQHHKRSDPSWPSKPQALGSKIFSRPAQLQESSPAPKPIRTRIAQMQSSLCPHTQRLLLFAPSRGGSLLRSASVEPRSWHPMAP